MSAEDCIKAIKDAVGEEFTEDLAEMVYTRLEKRTSRIMRDDPAKPRDKAIIEAATELSKEELLAALIQKRNEKINDVRRQALEDGIAKTGQPVSRALEAKVYGIEGKFYGAGESTDAKIYALKQHMRGALLHDLREAGVLEIARKGDRQFEAEVAREMSRLNGNTTLKQGNDAKATALATVLQKHTEAARLAQNEAGAYIRKMPGYVTRQSHDQIKIYKAGVDKWIDTITPLLDERTFEDVKDRDKFLRNIHSNLASGNHMKPGGDSDFLGGFKGPGNLAKRASAERVLQFKGPDEWMKYNDAFGRSTLYESVLDAIDYGARNTALMRDWGTNPEAMFQSIRDKATLAAKDAGDTKEVKALSGFGLQRAFDEITASVDIPGNVTLARVGSSIRLLQAVAKLGGMVLSSFPDLGVRAAMLRHNGVNLGERYTSGVADMFRNYKGTERRKIAEYVGVGIDGMTGDVFRQMSSLDTTPGKLAKVADKFFKLTFQTWWQDGHTRGLGLILSRQLADNIGTKFGELDGLYRTTLTRYGIGEKEWAALSKADTRVADGENFLTPDAAKSLDDDTIRGLLGKADAGTREINAARRDLETKLQVYVHDQIREGMTIAGARERSMLNLGTTAGTWGGEAIRLLMQFKTYPTTFIRRSLNREFNRDGVDYAGIGQLMAATTLLGFASLAAKDFAKGREPRWPEDPADQAKLWMAAMKQGGGLGLYGDFLLGETNRVGGTWGNTLLGPTFGGTALDIEKVFNAARRGDDPRAQAMRGVLNNTPFANLFYARMAADVVFLHSLQDAIDPGSVRRMQRRIERDNKQEFILPPTNYTGNPLQNVQQAGRDIGAAMR